jgi:hypothetical protein
MKSAHDHLRPDLASRALGAFSPESIAEVKDFTARKTLEQAHVFASGLAGVLLAVRDGEAAELAAELRGVGVSLADAEQIALEGVALIELMADRDRKADAFHAAVRAAGEGERALYDRLSSFARLLRLKLGAASPALAQFGVPPEGSGPPSRPRTKSIRPAALEALLPKS